MKKVFSLLLIGALFSCSGNEEVDLLEEDNKNVAKSASAELSAITIDNGLATRNGSHNIIVFPTIEHYKHLSATLDVAVENHVKAMEVNYEGVTDDDEIDIIINEMNFDEDKPLIDLENQLNFYSLRKDINLKETLWLEQQGDGEWDLTTDPDNHFILDDTERTLLNVGSEFIVGQTIEDYKIYKLYENAIIVFDWSEKETLKKINLGLITPSRLLKDIVKYDGRIKIEMPDSFIGVDPFVPSVPDYGPCKDKNDIRYIFNTSNNRRIKTVSKFHPAILFIRGNTIKAKTKVFKKSKVLGWIRANASIRVQLDCYGDYNATIGHCTTSNKILWSDYQTGTRHKVKVAWDIHHYEIKVVKNKIKSNHTHSGHKKEIDFYDGTVKHL